jgi:hypothetical protein
VSDYFFAIAPAAGALSVGYTAKKPFNLTFTGYVDDSPTNTYYPLTDAHYNFSNGWTAVVNGGPGTFSTPCGLVINFCVGVLGGPDYQVVQSDYTVDYALVIEGANSINGDPVNWFFRETVIFENKSDPNDFHYFEAGGRSIAPSEVPLPATLGLLFGALACTAGMLGRTFRFA